jgi:hypothetical protein
MTTCTNYQAQRRVQTTTTSPQQAFFGVQAKLQKGLQKELPIALNFHFVATSY